MPADFMDMLNQTPTDYNQNMFVVMRLNMLHMQKHNAVYNGDYNAYFSILDRIFNELIRVICNTKGEFQQKEEYKRHIRLRYNARKALLQIRKDAKEKHQYDDQLMEQLRYWDNNLAALEQQHGLGLTRGKNAVWSMG